MHPSKLMLSNTTETMHSDIYIKKIVEHNFFLEILKKRQYCPGPVPSDTTLPYSTPGTVGYHTTLPQVPGTGTTLHYLPPSISPFSAIVTSFFFLPLGFPLILVHPATPWLKKEEKHYLICGFSPQGGFGAFSAGNFAHSVCLFYRVLK